jgi:phenylacetate-CoA ligase
MNIANKIRKIGFWSIDFIKGGKIRKHYQDIYQIMENPFSEETLLKKNIILDKLLKHATTNVQFYYKYQNVSFNEFPVIKKNLILDSFDNFKSKIFLDQPLFKITTSGSTGVPFFIFINQNKRNRNIADTLYFFNKVGYSIGARLYYFRLWKGEAKGAIGRVVQNIVKVDVSRMTDEFIHDLLLKIKNDNSPKCFLGIASSFETFCNYLDKHNTTGTLNVNSISFIANSEALTPYTKKSIEKHFNVPIVSRYSNEEQGIIAQQELNSNECFKINWASYIVEIFEMEKDVPLNLGETGRIIVTDLFNYSMPLIRYDTGDIGVMNIVGDDHVLTTVEGRKMDLIYDTKGNLISSYSIYPKMHKYYDQMNQYQFVQTGEKEYLIKLNMKEEFKQGDDLINSFKLILGADAKIKIKYVIEIPPLSSGKRKKVMSTYKRN